MLDEEALLTAMLREMGEGDDELLDKLIKEYLCVNPNSAKVQRLTRENA